MFLYIHAMSKLHLQPEILLKKILKNTFQTRYMKEIQMSIIILQLIIV